MALKLSPAPPTEVQRAFRACRASLLMIFGLSLFINLLALAVPLYLLQIYDHVFSSRSLDTLVMLTIIVIFAVAIYAGLDAMRREMLTRIGSWLDDRLRPPVLTAAVQAALRNDAAAASQAWRDVGSIRSFFGSGGVTSLFDLPWTPIFVLAMFLVHPLIGIIGVTSAVILFGFALINEAAMRKPLSQASAALANSQHRVEALLRNAEVISAMGMLPGVARFLHEDHTQAKEAQHSAGTRAAAIQATSRFVRLLTQIVLMATTAALVIGHQVSPGAIFACSMLLARALGPVEGAIGTWKTVTTVRLGYRRLLKLMTAAPPPAKAMWLPRPKGALAVEQVSYVPSPGDSPVLRRVSFNLSPGQVLGIIGPSGAGKSTLGRLIAGTARPSAGHVRLDNADISVWMASGGHRYFGYLPQDVELFEGTVRDNIARLQEAEAEEVIAAAHLVGLHDTIMRLPRGYDTDIGEGGSRLSGGQRQRLGLARAFFGDPRLVVLDEPNSNLDAEGEEALRRAVERMRGKGATIVIIAQRLGILSVSDKIVVLKAGAVDAFGERREVIDKIKNGLTAIPVKKPRVANDGGEAAAATVQKLQLQQMGSDVAAAGGTSL